MSNKKIRFGVFGCADIAQRAFMPAIKKCDEAELTAVASRQLDKARSTAAKFNCDFAQDYSQLLKRDDIDAVYIALPNALNVEWIVEAARSKKHILCEKPLVANNPDGEKVVAICAQQNVALLEGFAYQYHPQHKYIKDIVDSGKIGEPRLFEAAFGFPPPLYSSYRFDKNLGGGALLDAGVYPIHVARKFFAIEPVAVNSALSSYEADQIKRSSSVDVHGAILLDFGKAKMAQLSFGYNNAYRNSYSVWGTKGRITIPNRAFSTPVLYKPTIIIEVNGVKKETILPPANCFLAEIRAFCNGLQDNSCRKKWANDILGQSKIISKIFQQNKGA